MTMYDDASCVPINKLAGMGENIIILSQYNKMNIHYNHKAVLIHINIIRIIAVLIMANESPKRPIISDKNSMVVNGPGT